MQSVLLFVSGTILLFFSWAAFEVGVKEPPRQLSYRIVGLVLMILGALCWRFA